MFQLQQYLIYLCLICLFFQSDKPIESEISNIFQILNPRVSTIEKYERWTKTSTYCSLDHISEMFILGLFIIIRII